MAYTGSLAEQVIRGATIMVIKRSLRSSIVRVAIIPGTAQAKEESIGIKDFPESPDHRNIRSTKKAARDMYPESSKTAIKINKMAI
jgi:hypothetical protein